VPPLPPPCIGKTVRASTRAHDGCAHVEPTGGDGNSWQKLTSPRPLPDTPIRTKEWAGFLFKLYILLPEETEGEVALCVGDSWAIVGGCGRESCDICPHWHLLLMSMWHLVTALIHWWMKQWHCRE
jgi:hypothetical protein